MAPSKFVSLEFAATEKVPHKPLIRFFKSFILRATLPVIMSSYLPVFAYCQAVTIEGKVFSKDLREPMVFVTISFAEGQKGTTSDIDGNYSLTQLENSNP
jgi:hypothetical protein